MSQPPYPPYPPYPPNGYYAPYPPPPAPPRQSSLTWLWITLSVVGGVLIVCCVLPLTVGVIAILRDGTGTFNGGTPTTPTVIARPVSGLTGATLGGTLTGFEAAYGAATRTSPADASWAGASIAGQQVALYITLATGQDGNLHVTSAQASPVGIGATWDSQTAIKVMSALFPSDTQTAGDASGDPNALIHIYTSALLGQTLQPAQSANTATTPTPTGEFNVACQLASGSNSAVSYCFMANGAP